MSRNSSAMVPKFGDWNSGNQTYTIMFDKMRAEKSMETKASSTRKPDSAQAAASGRTYNQKDHDYMASFPNNNNKSNIMNNKAASELQQRGLIHKNSNYNNNTNDGGERDYSNSASIFRESHGDQESLSRNHKSNGNNYDHEVNEGRKFTPSQYKGRLVGNRRSVAAHEQPRRGAAGTRLNENLAAAAPRFGEWDVKNQTQFTAIFDRMKQEKEASLSGRASPALLPPLTPPRNAPEDHHKILHHHHKKSPWWSRCFGPSKVKE